MNRLIPYIGFFVLILSDLTLAGLAIYLYYFLNKGDVAPLVVACFFLTAATIGVGVYISDMDSKKPNT
jgi:hypothetical protein